MGEFPARIVAQDFVTPPEFADWRLAHDGAGRIGGVRITLANRQGRTFLADVYEQVPVRVLPVDLGPAQPHLVYLLNPTAGLLDGDAHLMTIHAGPHTRSVITGQSATRIHPCLKGFSTQQWNVTVADDAILVVLPGPAIPFEGCRFFQRIQIHLGKNAQLVWGDLWFAGRFSRFEESERFRFQRIVQEMSVWRQGSLIYRDRFDWQGPWNNETAHWHFADHPVAGSLFFTGLSSSADIPNDAATFTTAAGDTCCRLTGSSEMVTRWLGKTCFQTASRMANGQANECWLLDGHRLANTHWFSDT